MCLFLFLLQRYKKVLTYAIGKSLFVCREIPIVYLHILAGAPRPNRGLSRIFTGNRAYCTQDCITFSGMYYVQQLK